MTSQMSFCGASQYHAQLKLIIRICKLPNIKLNEVVSPDLYTSLLYFQILLHSHVQSQTKYQLCRGYFFRDQVSKLGIQCKQCLHWPWLKDHNASGLHLLDQASSVKLVFQNCCKHRSHIKTCLVPRKKKIQRWLFKVCTFDALYFIHLSKASLIRMDKYLIMLIQEKHWP